MNAKPVPQNATGSVKADTAASNITEELLDFDPRKYLNTLRCIAIKPKRIGNAIVQQDWTTLLSPLKYFSASLTLFLLAYGALSGAGSHDFTGWSPNHAFFWKFIFIVALPFMLAQFLALSTSIKTAITGSVNGLAKLFQCYLLTIGTGLTLFALLDLMMSLEDASARGGMAVAIANFLVVAAFFWVVVISSSRILSAAFSATFGAAVSAFVCGTVAALVGMQVIRMFFSS